MSQNSWYSIAINYINKLIYGLFLNKKKKKLFIVEKKIILDIEEKTKYAELNDAEKKQLKLKLNYIFEFCKDFNKVYENFIGNLFSLASVTNFIKFLKESSIYKEKLLKHIFKSIIATAFFIYTISRPVYICEDKSLTESFANCSCVYNNNIKIMNIKIYNNNITIYNKNTSNTSYNMIKYNIFYLNNNNITRNNKSINNNNNITYYINYNINNSIINISNINNSTNIYTNNNFWYCQYGKCQVKIINFNTVKFFKIIYFIFFDLFIIAYKFQFFITFKKFEIDDNWLRLYQIVEFVILSGIFLLNYFNTKKCAQLTDNLFSRESRIELGELFLTILLNRIFY